MYTLTRSDPKPHSDELIPLAIAHEFGKLTLKEVEFIAWPIPLIGGMFIDGALHHCLGCSNGIR